mgnify:CR=1 FL=1
MKRKQKYKHMLLRSLWIGQSYRKVESNHWAFTPPEVWSLNPPPGRIIHAKRKKWSPFPCVSTVKNASRWCGWSNLRCVPTFSWRKRRRGITLLQRRQGSTAHNSSCKPLVRIACHRRPSGIPNRHPFRDWHFLSLRSKNFPKKLVLTHKEKGHALGRNESPGRWWRRGAPQKPWLNHIKFEENSNVSKRCRSMDWFAAIFLRIRSSW